MDWEKNKKVVGDGEELNAKTKDGVLNKMRFLQDTDYKQFERERDMREQVGPGERALAPRAAQCTTSCVQRFLTTFLAGGVGL